MKTFTEWKSDQVKADSLKFGVFKHYRERDWYFKAYGAYCNKSRAAIAQVEVKQ